MTAKAKKSGKTTEITISAQKGDGAVFAPFMFGNASEEDIRCYDAKQLEAAASLAVEALVAQKAHESIVTIDHQHVQKKGTAVSVITLVNDNKPFLLDSILGAVQAVVSAVYLVAHPIFDIAEHKKGEITLRRELFAEQPQKPWRRVSVVQIHVNALGRTEAKELENTLNMVLAQVDAAVRDWKPMVDEIGKLIAQYQKNAAKLKGDVAGFLSWLQDNNFTFLGMRQYDFHMSKKPQDSFKAHGAALGILTDASIRVLGDPRVQEAPREILSFMESDSCLIVTKANTRSLVHRPVWLDYIGVKLFDDKGELMGEMRIVGLFTATAYTSSVLRIPYLKEKAKTVIKRLGFSPADHSGKALMNILENYPRDEMFRTDVGTLSEHVRLILALGERPRIRVLTHADPFGRFVSVLAFIPLEQYDSQISEKVGAYFVEAYGGDFCEAHTYFMGNNLIRMHYIVHRKSVDAAPKIKRDVLEARLRDMTSNWQDTVRALAEKQKCDSETTKLAASLPVSYRDAFLPQAALQDAAIILGLDEKKPLHVLFYHHQDDGECAVSLKLYHYQCELALSQRVPLLENMGFRVIAEQTLELPDGRGGKVYLHDMQLQNAFDDVVDLSDGGKRLADAFEAIWAKEADNDGFNGLIQSAGLDWREIVVLRAFGRYLQQAGIPYSQSRLAEALNRYPKIARTLYDLFDLKFNPASAKKDSQRAETTLQNAIENALQKVPSLDDDLILRRMRNLITASLRTNAYLQEKDGSPRRTLAIKLNPREVEGLPDPKPYREIFVYGPDVEGVHLRFGPVARGGIRWSDRALDYRTEILGLVKAQQVKNAVIVPVGSKGGFFPHHLPQSNDRAVVGEAARQAYITYISAMLSITDNIVKGKVAAPKGIVRHDGDDPYFVVAADKGTATFSDTANAISEANHFWLDDAFASGGSAGYDHKEMGITARGAWEAVKRHFRELFNRDIQKQPFSVVGVGDMSGDVFGNGMLLSKQTRLIAAFDHRDIFIDPDPDMAAAFAERQRLFKLPRSSWQDYDRKKLSKGGEIYSRTAKTITLSPEAAKAIGFDRKSGTPFEIMTAILKADVDLLWFGGIGTYIRSSSESDAQVGDRANDVIRITGKDVRAKVIGEGANLGMTQRGRIEYSMAGGRCDTDAVDNSAGVNCSDVEVNIKIGLAAAVQKGKLTRPARDKLLKEMTPDVAKLVLRNNYLQPLVMSLAEKRGVADLPYQMRFMSDLERRKLLDRRVEILPDDQVLTERLQQGIGLARPELAVLMAYAKLTLQEEVTATTLVDDGYFRKTLFSYFPPAMQEKYAEEIEGHQLRRDIVATALANDIVNRGGPTFVARLQDKTGQPVEAVIRAYIATRDGFNTSALYDAIDALDNKIPGDVQTSFYRVVTSMLFATVGWMLRNVDVYQPLETLVTTIREANRMIEEQMAKIVPENLRKAINAKAASYVAQGAPKALANELALLDVASIVPDVALITRLAKSDLGKTAQIYFTLAETFRLNRIEEAARAIPVVDYYDGMALAQANDTISAALRGIALHVVKDYGKEAKPVEAWQQAEAARVDDVILRMSALIEGDLNISRFTVAASMLANLAPKG